MGASDTTGVAADWLTSVWGQNSAIYQTAPAAATAEEAVAAWLLELLDLPRQSSVGLVTGATMARFVGFAAARHKVLADAGHNFDPDGLQGAPTVRVYLGADTHVSNIAALRYLGFGEANIVRIPCCPQGLVDVGALAAALEDHQGPKIIIATPGQINTGGFAIVRHSQAHREAMDMSASYLNRDRGDGRNPTEWNPELSRRARGFVAWAMIRPMGRRGIRDLLRRHCQCAADLARELASIDGLTVANRVELNQVLATAEDDALIGHLSRTFLGSRTTFLRATTWRDKPALRFSVISGATGPETIACTVAGFDPTLRHSGKISFTTNRFWPL